MNFEGEECGEIGATFLFRRLGILMTHVGRMKYLRNRRPLLLDIRAFVYHVSDVVTMKRVDEFILRAAWVGYATRSDSALLDFQIFS